MTGRVPIEELVRRLAALVELGDELPDESTPLGIATREFLRNNWSRARDGVLARTTRLRVDPEPTPAPRVFHFELDGPYKRKRRPDALVELVEGTLRGTIRYRSDLYTAPAGEPSLAVLVDPSLRFFHPNHSRLHGALCLGHLPPGPFPLEDLLEHLYGILTYQNLSTSDPADPEAAAYFARDPHAMRGLETVEPLYP